VKGKSQFYWGITKRVSKLCSHKFWARGTQHIHRNNCESLLWNNWSLMILAKLAVILAPTLSLNSSLSHLVPQILSPFLSPLQPVLLLRFTICISMDSFSSPTKKGYQPLAIMGIKLSPKLFLCLHSISVTNLSLLVPAPRWPWVCILKGAQQF
jgi:hypothetical protein